MALSILSSLTGQRARAGSLMITALPLALAAEAAFAQANEAVATGPDARGRSGQVQSEQAQAVALPNLPAEQGTETDDIVVTALRGTARLQDVPATVAVLGNTQIASRGVRFDRPYSRLRHAKPTTGRDRDDPRRRFVYGGAVI